MRNRKYEKCCGCARVREIKSLIFGPFSYNVHRTDTAEQSRIQHTGILATGHTIIQYTNMHNTHLFHVFE